MGTFEELAHLGVGFVSLTEALDMTTATGRAMALSKAEIQTDRIETMLRDIGRALGLAFPRA